MAESSLRRNWPILVATIATGVIAVQVARFKWSRLGEQDVKDPKIAQVQTRSSSKGPDIAKGWIGWAIKDTPDGVLVVDVFEGGPAARAGVEKGDLVMGVGGDAPATQQKIFDAILTHGPGYDLDFEIKKPDSPSLTVYITIEQKSGVESLCMRTIAVACSGLAALQTPSGLWPHYLPNAGESRTSIGTTALACAALALAGKDAGEDGPAALEKGLSVLLGKIAKDGGLDDPADPIPHRVYANSFLLLALAQDKAKHPKELESVRSWLARAQIGGEGWEWVDPLDTRYGGWSYHKEATPRTLRADVSTASWALDALAASGLPADRVEWSRAARFLERCQNRELLSTREDARASERPYRDGGFAFTPRYSKASSVTVSDELVVQRSYGSATADGLRGLVAVAADDYDHDARDAALQWLGRNYTLARNPGFAQGDMSGWDKGVYFYWLASMARALDQAKVDRIERGSESHAWPDELARVLANFETFVKKHVFASGNDQMHEDSPTLCTAFAVIALCAARDRVRATDGSPLTAGAVPPPPPELTPWTAPDLSLVEKGRTLFQSSRLNCTSCHHDAPDPNAPSLVGVADRFLEWKKTRDAAKAYLKKHIRDPEHNKGTHPDGWVAKMPAYGEASGLTDEELDWVVEFLLSREGSLPVSEAR